MKLISLYIENFGGLHRYELNFEDGLTVIEESNGFGKTTLAEFIRAMFYGFPRKGKTLDKSRRQKYTPWNGGKFGGNLVFELDGVRYRVERSFGATPKGDSFALIDLATGKKSNRFSEELGLELFQLDADSFERSTYLPQMADGQGMTTDSIRSKLSNLVEDTNDVGNFEKAVAALKAKRSTFVPYRGSGGSVAKANGQITTLQDQLHRTENLSGVLEQTEENIRNLQQAQENDAIRLEQLRKELRQASEAVAVKLVHRQHGQLLEQYEAADRVCRDFEEKYPAGIPTWEQIDGAGNAAVQLDILNSRNVTEQDDLDAQRFLEQNRARFEAHLPTAEELTACRNLCAEQASLRSRTMELAAKLTRRQPAKANPLLLVLLLLVFAGATGLGIVLLRKDAILSYIALGIGAAALIGSIFAAIRLIGKSKQLQQFRQEQQLIHADMERLSAEAERLTAEIRFFLGGYGTVQDTDFYGQLAELEHSSNAYLRAGERVIRWQREMARHDAELTHWNGALETFFESAGLVRADNVRVQLQQMRLDRDDCEEATESRARLCRELAAFRQEHAETLALPVSETAVDLDTLRQAEVDVTVRLNGCAEELLRQQQRREQLLAQVRLLPQLREDLQLWQEKKQADQKKSDLLDDTLSLLEQAKENLSGNYLGPIRRSFAGYLSKLWQDQQGQVLVTPDLDVQLERFGEARELGYFSAGQSDMVMLGMRFALVDALFRETRPFVILDDPFVNLDDSHTARALELLRTLSQDRQIIYLTCNSSRAPK